MVTKVGDLPTLPAIVDGTVSHARRGNTAHSFTHKAYQWLVDLDQIPKLPWYLRPLASFRALDHLGVGSDGSTTIKTNVIRYLAHQDIDLGPDGRVVMLANARVFGYVFDPLTVFWCFDSNGELRCLVAEVHNTYGERHAYLLRPSVPVAVNTGVPGADHAEVDKAFYVSPFHDVSGHYQMSFRLSIDRVRVGIALTINEHMVFSAAFSGAPALATRRSILKTALRRPLMPQKVSTLIRLHGVWLWLRRVPIQERPVHRKQEGVS